MNYIQDLHLSGAKRHLVLVREWPVFDPSSISVQFYTIVEM